MPMGYNDYNKTWRAQYEAYYDSFKRECVECGARGHFDGRVCTDCIMSAIERRDPAVIAALIRSSN